MGKTMQEATRKRVRAGRMLLAGKRPAQAAAADSGRGTPERIHMQGSARSGRY